MHGNHHAALTGRAFFICRHFKAIIPNRIFYIGIPTGNQQPAVGVLFAGVTNGIHKNLIVLVQICIILPVRVAVVCSVTLFVHGLENQMFIIVCETLCNLFPNCLVLFANHILVFAVYQKPAVLNGVISIAVYIDDDIQAFIVTVLDYLFHTIQPR